MKTVDMTPTWVQTITMFNAILEAGTDEGKEMVWKELTRMATLLDEYNSGWGDEKTEPR